MILYYSGIRADICSPSVVLGDKANVMLSFFECAKKGQEPAAGFLRLKSERMKKNRKKFKAYRDYQSDRRHETNYMIVDQTKLPKKIIAGPTPLLTSLVCDCVPKIGHYIVRIERDATWINLYRATSDGWDCLNRKAKS